MTVPTAGSRQVIYDYTGEHKHTCRRCKTHSSVFWYPYAWGVGIDEDGVVHGGQHFEMCDECHRSFIDWMVKGDKS